MAYRNQGDYDKAIADFTAALGLEPLYAPALNNRGNAYFYKGEYDQSIADYNAALKINPDLSDVRYNIERARNARGF